MNKYISYIGIIMLTCFSFFYTDKAVDIIRRNDPIMKEIENNKNVFSVEAVNATIEDNNVITGLSGKAVNVDKSYENMKKMNSYNESMLVFDEILPVVRADYSNYLVGGSNLKNQVALVFNTDSIYYLKNIINILNSKNVKATLFIDGKTVEDNMSYVETLSDNYEIENYGYDGEYSDIKFKWVNNMIYSLTRKDTKYCFTEYRNDDVLDLCSKNKLYTVKPTIIASKQPFISVKNNINSGSIISFNINSSVIKEISSVINYINQKGYEIVKIEELLSEKTTN